MITARGTRYREHKGHITQQVNNEEKGTGHWRGVNTDDQLIELSVCHGLETTSNKIQGLGMVAQPLNPALGSGGRGVLCI